MKKNLPFTILLVFLVLMNGALLFLLFNKGPKQERRPRQMISEVLGFKGEQLDKFRLLDNTHHEKMLGFEKEIGGLRAQLLGDISQNNLLANERDSIIALMGDLDEDKNRELYEFFIQVDMLCNASQKERLRRIVQRSGARDRPPPRRP